jgi:putative Mg2+ transporter-C (MgtC) family protein
MQRISLRIHSGGIKGPIFGIPTENEIFAKIASKFHLIAGPQSRFHRFNVEDNMLTWQETLIRLFIAAVLGGLIGLDRGRRDLGAGLRTHMLVSVGSALIMLVSSYGFSHTLKRSLVVLDPSRVAAQVVSGIGFLGAGTILLRKEIVKGLTTAAGIWAVAAIGLAVGAGLYAAALFATAIMLGILVVLKPIERRFLRRWHKDRVIVTLDPDRCELSSVAQAVQRSNISAAQLQIDYQFTGETGRFERVDLLIMSRTSPRARNSSPSTAETLIELIGQLKKLPGILKIESATRAESVNNAFGQEETR